MPLRVGGEDGRVVVVGVRSLVDDALHLRIGIASGLSRVGALGGVVCVLLVADLAKVVDIRGLLRRVLRIGLGSSLSHRLRGLHILDLISRLHATLIARLVGGDVLGCLFLRGLALRLIGPRFLSLVGGGLRPCIGLSGGPIRRLRGLHILDLISRLHATLVGGGVLDVRVLRSRALSLGILSALSALGVLVRLLCLRLDTSFARVGILSIVLCLVTRIVGARRLSFAGCGLRIGLSGSLSHRFRGLHILGLIIVNRPGLIGGLVLVHRSAAVSGRLRRLGRLRLRRVPLTESRIHSGLASRTISRSRSPCVTHATSSTGGRVVGQVTARTEIGEDLDVPGTGQPAEQVGIGGRVGRQRRPQVGPALCDGGLQGLVRSLSGNGCIGLMRRHHELNRIHAEPFRENVWVTSTDRARSQPILGPSPGSDHPRW